MRRRLYARPVVLAIGLVALLACSTRPILTGTITADGSTKVFRFTSDAAQQFKLSHPDVHVTVGSSGTAEGFRRFCAGEIDLQNASRPIRPDEHAECSRHGVRYVELPVAYAAITVVVHSANIWARSMTVLELHKLWAPEAQGRVRRWSQIRDGWPDREVHLFGPLPDSRTFSQFTERIVGVEDESRRDYTASEDDAAIVDSVVKDELALGYVEFDHFWNERGRLSAVSIDDGDDTIGRGPIEPTALNVRQGVYRPLTSPLLIYVNVKSLRRDEVASFITSYTLDADLLVERAGGIALRISEYELVRQRFARRVQGSVFLGTPTPSSTVEVALARAR
jgi:phosphate transport system substrate-binding protein